MRNRNFLRRIVFAGFLALLPLLPLSAQKTSGRTVSGTVYDETGERFPGVGVITLDRKFGVLTNADGQFVLTGLPASATILVEIMGYKTQEFKVSGIPQGERLDIYLELDSETLQETVVTGIFTRRKDSFTGSVQTVTSDEIKKISNANVIASLKVIDPSMVVLENLAAGSDPNAMADIQIRGASTLSTATQSLKSDYLNSGNTPLFILDGFETSLQKITDMDMNRVQSITILKDASAKAIYGSKGANGVIVIETKALTGNRAAVTYTGSVTLEAPDLTSYNLCNALEKLEVERREGFYYPTRDSQDITPWSELYYQRLKRATEGESTYWLSKPLRLGIGNKHSIGVELGAKDLKAFATFAYNRVNGTMKGSYRQNISGDINLSYRKDKWTFRNIMSIGFMKSEDSPYGNFSEYALMNPYFTPYDEDGHLKKIVAPATFTGSNGVTISHNQLIANPMWNAAVGTRYLNSYMDFTDNLYVEYQMLPSLRIVGRAGVTEHKTESEDFLPAEHTSFVKKIITNEDDRLNRGSYNVSNGTYTTFSADVTATYNHKVADVHDIFATAQYNISETKYEEIMHYTVGFPNSNMTSITYARQYAPDLVPSGGDGLNRNLGALLTGGYTYDNRYMADATLKASASSVFGTDRHWGLFWSAGLAWNIHKEAFLKDASWLRQLKLRGSVGSSGNQNFTTNTSLPVYSYFSQGYYNGFSGAHLTTMENRNLGWEEKMDYNVGIDFRTARINMILDAYIADTRNLVFARSILPSTGFPTVSDNLGIVRNKGIELQLSYILWQRGASYFSIFGKAATNDNRVLAISDALEAYNAQQQAAAEEMHQLTPVVQYYNGVPVHAIWAVPSLGVNPIDGNEIFIDRNGNLTDTWKATNLAYAGSSDPLVNGNFGFNGEIKGFGFNVVSTFYAGGYLYNSTLVNKVENTYIENNVDRRIFSGRWFEKGQVAQYRNGVKDTSVSYDENAINTNMTMPTTRFVQRNNVLHLSSLSIYYELPLKWARKLSLQRLRTTLYANDLYTFSSIEIERGTSYPYARSFSLSVTATF